MKLLLLFSKADFPKIFINGFIKLVELVGKDNIHFDISLPLDEYFRNLKDEIALIKMDVQGAEFLILEGMKNLIKKVKVVIFEYWPDGLKVAGFKPIELLNLLKKYNFKIFYVDQNLNINNITNKIDVKGHINLIAINKELISKR